MEEHARYTLVGFFVVVVTVGIVLTIMWLYNRGGSGAINFYSIYFHEQTLDGLQIDSNVTIRGIKVGSVSTVKLSPKNVENVKVVIRVQADTPVKRSTRAVIKRNLLTGLAYIDLQDSKSDSPTLDEIPHGEDYPLIPEGHSDLDKVASSIPAVLDSVNIITERASGFLTEENQESFSTILKNLAAASETLGRNDKKIDQIIQNTAEATASVAKVSKSVDRFMQDGEAHLQDIGTKVSSAAEQIGNLALDFKTKSEDTLAEVRASADLLTQQISILSQGLVQASDSINVTAEKFQNPRSAIFGPQSTDLGPGESIGK